MMEKSELKNLKNRPTATLFGCIKCDRWFEGFEKEQQSDYDRSFLHKIETESMELKNDRERKIARLFRILGKCEKIQQILGKETEDY